MNNRRDDIGRLPSVRPMHRGAARYPNTRGGRSARSDIR